MRDNDQEHGFKTWFRRIAIAGLLACSTAAAGKASAPLGDPVALNIGISCQWQQRCMSQQNKAMKRALKFVKKEQPATWRVEMCNRNAKRNRYRVDWIGFNNCIRNAELRPPPPRPVKKQTKRPSHSQTASRSLGERG